LTVLGDWRKSDMSLSDRRTLIVDQVLCDRFLGWSRSREWGGGSTVCGTRQEPAILSDHLRFRSRLSWGTKQCSNTSVRG
jgi:hypothetical protein